MTLGEFLTALGYATGAAVFFWASWRRGLATEGFRWVLVGGFVGAAIGAKLLELVVEGWPRAIPVWAGLDPHTGGRALLGGVVGGWIGVEIVKRRIGLRRSTGDLFALALPAGEAVGRIGCYYNQCCYGSVWSGPWAIWQHGAWRHPAQIYSSLTALALFGVLLWLAPRVRPEGALFRWYLVGFGVSRFLLEFVRWRETVIYGLSPMQWACIELAAYGAIWLAVKGRRVAREAAA